MNERTPTPAEPPRSDPSETANSKSLTGAWIAGLLITLAAGAILDVVSTLIAAALQEPSLTYLIGIVPGLCFAVPAGVMARRQKSFAGMSGGVCVGGCLIALIGGACASSFAH